MSSTKYELHITGEFKQDLKRCKKRGRRVMRLGAFFCARCKILGKNVQEYGKKS